MELSLPFSAIGLRTAPAKGDSIALEIVLDNVIGLVESGVPLGVTFSYLIAAPMINEVAAVLLLGLFGWKIALIYIVSGVIISIVAGFILGKMKLEKYVEDYVWKIKVNNKIDEEKKIVRLLDYDHHDNVY